MKKLDFIFQKKILWKGYISLYKINLILVFNKNIIIQIFQTAIGITKFSLLVTFYLDWEIILMRHPRASIPGALINQRLQKASNKYWSKKFPLQTQWRSSIPYGIVIIALVQRQIIKLNQKFNISLKLLSVN
jgi:hypothetical protein